MVTKSYPKEKNIIKVPRFEEKAGFVTTKQRSKIMSKIRGKNSVPELLLRRALWVGSYPKSGHILRSKVVSSFRSKVTNWLILRGFKRYKECFELIVSS